MSRNATLDYARLLAAFGIVLFHSGAPGSVIGYAALPFFLMLLMVMALPGARQHGFTHFAAGRARRLLVPWLIWSVIYGGLKLAEALVTHRTLASEFHLTMLLTGPAIHLWFLPFAFAACLMLYPLARLPHGAETEVASLAGLSAMALGALALQKIVPLPVPLAQWVFSVPAVALGLAFALLHGKILRPVSVAAVFVAATALAWSLGWTTGLLQLVLAVGALILCLQIRLAGTAVSRVAADASLGVYLCHPLISSVLQRTIPLDPHGLTFCALTFLGALLLALGIGATTRWLEKRSAPLTTE